MEQIGKMRKFEDAYCLTTQSLMTIDEAAELYRSDFQSFHSVYKPYLLCPECRKVQLTYVNDTPPYFRTYPGSCHEENCLLQQETVSSKKVLEYINSPKNSEQIDRQMNRLIAMLSQKNTSAVFSKSKSPVPRDETVSETNGIRPAKGSKTLPVKRIDVRVGENDLDVFKLFYGIVALKWVKANSGRFGIILSSVKSGTALCAVWITQSVYEYIPEEYKKPDTYTCAISVLAALTKGDNGMLFTSLRNSRFLKIGKSDL